MFIKQLFTRPAIIPFGKTLIESADVNTPNTAQNDYIELYDDQRALTEQTTNITLTANRDIFVPVNTAGGVVTVTLPAGANHTTQPIVISKVSNDYNIITINRSGTDVLDLPWATLATPVSTSITMRLAGERIALYPILKGGVYVWRVVDYFLPANLYRASAFRSSNQGLSGGAIFDRINFANESYDLGGFYDNVTNFRFTPLISGIYRLDTNIIISSGTASDTVVRIRKSGADLRQVGQDNTSANFGITYSFDIPMNGSTDYIDLTANSAGGRNILGDAGGTFSTASLSLTTRN